MHNVSTTPPPVPMEGDGGYNRRSQVQAAGLAPAIPLLEEAARAVSLPPASQPIVIADYGSSQGRNSLKPMSAAIAVLRERVGPERAISVVHVDQPGNDFASLFRTLEADPDTYMHDAVFASAVGRSFYEQVLPAGTVTLGWSSWAVQWLSHAPGPIPDHVQIACSADEAARRAYLAQSAADWRQFLAMRARELQPGGRLVVMTMALDEAGDLGYGPLLDAIMASLSAMVADGTVSAQEMRRMAIPTVGRSLSDLLAPFASGSFEGLRVETAEVFAGEDHNWARFLVDGDAGQFGRSWAAFTSASVFPTLAAALDDDPGGERAAAFSVRLEEQTAAALAAAPQPMPAPLGKISMTLEP